MKQARRILFSIMVGVIVYALTALAVNCQTKIYICPKVVNGLGKPAKIVVNLTAVQAHLGSRTIIITLEGFPSEEVLKLKYRPQFLQILLTGAKYEAFLNQPTAGSLGHTLSDEAWNAALNEKFIPNFAVGAVQNKTRDVVFMSLTDLKCKSGVIK